MLKSRRDTGHDRGSCSQQSHFFQPRYVSHFYSYLDSYVGNFLPLFVFSVQVYNMEHWTMEEDGGINRNDQSRGVFALL